MTDLETLSRIEAMTDALRSFGYCVEAVAIPGQEEIFLDTLDGAYGQVCKVFAHNARRYGYRGKSKNALAALHADLPHPAWGIGVSPL